MTLLLRAGFAACLLVGTLLTGLRILQPDHGLPVRLISFAPLGLGVHLLALLLLLVLARDLLPRRGAGASSGARPLTVRSAVAGATAAALTAAVVLHVAWQAPLHVGCQPEPATSAASR